jgi:hypothetical protein
MKKTAIKNLDALEKEIYRMKLEARQLEEKLDTNFSYLKDNYGAMAINSLFHKKKKNEDSTEGFFDSFIKNDTIKTVVSKVTDHIADRAADGINDLIDKLTNKKD